MPCRSLFVWLFALSCLLFLPTAAALQLSEKMSVTAYDAEGRAYPIGTLHSEPQGDAFRVRFELTGKGFSEHFLSMRPFRCLVQAPNMVCFLEYPYELRGVVSADDLTDLEYQLLFLKKTPTEYGINPWNGLYYKLRVDGKRLIGELHETDLNVLAAPPEEGDLRPIKAEEVYEADDNNWLPRLVIE